MLIVGSWYVCEDGVTRPTVVAHVQGNGGQLHHELFLVDTAADRTAFSAALLLQLSLPANAAPAGFALEGIGGQTGFVQVNTVIEFRRDDGGWPLSVVTSPLSLILPQRI